MLAVPWPRPFTEAGWLFEPKWDGIRAVVSYDGTSTSIRTRSGTEVAIRYPELSGSFASPVVLDGEIVTLVEGIPSFERLQKRIGISEPARAAAAAAEAPVDFIAFDVMHLDKETLVDRPIEERREVLDSLELPASVGVSGPISREGMALWSAIVDRDLEGMVAKRLGSPYRPGSRSHDWRKIHHVNSIRAVVGGFSPGERGRSRTFGALQMGLWDGDALRWVGAVGTGFSDADLVAIRQTLDSLTVPETPFVDDDALPADTVFVQPVLVAMVGFRDWTTAHRLRHPRFKGFTDDAVEEITWSAEGPTDSRSV